MTLLDIVNAPWAIMPEKLIEMRDIYVTHLRGDKIDVKAIEAAIGKPLNNKAEGYTVDRGVAVVPINGVISKRANLFTQICGGTSTQLLERDVNAALNDPTVHSIILAIESPGGEVDGTQAAAAAIRAVRGKKPIVALADGLMASAAYWLGSAADSVYITGDTTMMGSIGVVMTHVDYSKAEAARGVKVTEVTAGKFKRIASEHEPLNDEGRADIQGKVDHIYGVFLSEIAQHRATSVDVVHEKMADGRVFMGKQAIDAGLADGVSSLAGLVAKLNQKRAMSAAGTKGAVAPKSKTEGKGDMEKVLIAGAECLTQAEVEAAVARVTAEASVSGANAERERIQAVEAVALAGHDQLIATLKFDGKTSGPEAAAQIVAAEKTLRSKVAADLRKDGPQIVPPSQPAADGGEKKDEKKEVTIDGAKALAAKAQEYVAAQAKDGKKITYAEAVMHLSSQAKKQ